MRSRAQDLGLRGMCAACRALWLAAVVLATASVVLLAVSASSARAATSPSPFTGSLNLEAGAPGLPMAASSQSAVAQVLRSSTGLTPAQVSAQNVCPEPSPGHAACEAQVLVSSSTGALVHPQPHTRQTFSQVFPTGGAAPAAGTTSTPQTPPQAASPAWLQQAYDLSYLSQTAGAGDTVAVVDAFDDPTAESDLATYRSQFGLPPCTTANGCFRKVNQNGQASPLPSPSSYYDNWEPEESLDLDAVSALCPKCHIIFVEANDDYINDLDTGIAAAQRLGANQISNSWGANGGPSGVSSYPGVAVIAATGDHGYPGAGVDAYPAAYPGFTAAGGTSLSYASGSPRGYTETAWSLSGGWGGTSGCATTQSKPTWQTDVGCTGRSYSDLSADADPNTGIFVYDTSSGGWVQMGGTSLASPLIAGFEAVAGGGPNGQWAYNDSALLNDPIYGSTGSCASNISYICNARPGYDGPTGIGSISGDITTGAPGVQPSSTQNVTQTAANLSGGVYPNGLDTTYYWQYSVTVPGQAAPAFNHQTAPVDVGAGQRPVAASTSLTGLTLGTTYDYRLVAKNSAGTIYGYDYTFSTVGNNSPPFSTSTPTITGTIAQGDVVTVNSTWSPAPQSYAYQWQRSTDSGSTWQNITGATAASYTLSSTDENALVRAIVTASNQYGSNSATSATAGPVAANPPANTVVPAITGTTQRTYSVSASTGTWSGPGLHYSYQWQESPDGTTWHNVSGATNPSYRLGVSDEGEFVRVVVSASNVDGIASAGSAATQPVSPFPPGNSALPTIIGTPERTFTLTALQGTWVGPDNTYSYRWQEDFGEGWTDITGATGTVYTLQAADEGAAVRVVVTATNPDGAIQEASAPTTTVQAALPANVSPPTLQGTAQRDSTLTATLGMWDGQGNTYSYQWQHSSDGNTWTDITGATTSTYSITTADEGFELRALIIATNSDGTAQAPTPATQSIQAAPPVSTSTPSFSGTVTRGATLYGNQGVWSGIGNNYSLQWQRSADGSTWTDITGATALNYTLQVADEDDAVRLVVTATNPDGTQTTASAPSAAVQPSLPVDTAAPSVTGTAQRSFTLTGNPGAWSGVGNTYSYQWQSSIDGTTWTNVNNATTLAYTLGAGDEGTRLRLLVSATNLDGTVSAASWPTATVAGAPPTNSAAPTIAGTPLRGNTLTSDPGSWGGIGNTYVWQWQRSSDGVTWTNISGASGPSYTITRADENNTLRLLLTASNPDGSLAVQSPSTGTVPVSPPVNTAAPALSGVAQRGLTLTGTQGTWGGIGNTYAYQWQRSSDGTTWTDITGATSLTYGVAVADEGDQLRLAVTASNVDGSVTAPSQSTAAATAAAPMNTALPTVTGTAQRSFTLSATPGTWTGNGNAYTYQWQHDTGSGFTDIASATGLTYTLGVSDEGSRVRLVVTATNPDGTVGVSSSATTTVTSAPPLNSIAPAITGTAQRSLTLTSAAGSWSGIGNTYAYQWQRSADAGATWQNIDGATDTTYTLTQADEGDIVRLSITATNPDGSLSMPSAPSGPVAAAPPVNNAAPTVTGTAQRASTLTGTQGSWGGLGNTITLQWQRSADGVTWSDITGATGATYTLAMADEGETVRLHVTASNADGTVGADSAPTARVAAATPVNTGAPAVSGVAERASSLTATHGTWSGPDNTYAYQWQQSTDSGATWRNVGGATNATYLLGVADEGARLRVEVTATNPDASVIADSAPTSTVAAAPPTNTVAPTISGQAQRTAMLSATQGAWGGIGNTYGYQWERTSNFGASWTNISGATSPTYTLVSADEGDNVRVVVTATNPDGSVSAPSAASAIVQAAPPVNVTPPAISGQPRNGATLTVGAGNWSPSGATTFTYRWQRSSDGASWQDIAGASASTYTLSSADVLDTIRALVTATNPDGSATAPTAPTATILSPPNNTTSPAAPTGTLQNTYTLTANPGSWDAPATYNYAWMRCPAASTSIDSGCSQVASGATYVVQSADVGSKLGVNVTASASGGSAVAASALTAVIAGRPLTNLTPPSITGNPQVTQWLSANQGTWSVPLSSVAYAWQRCDGDGTSDCMQTGTGSSYHVSTDDLGHTIVLLVTATSPGQSTTARSSALTVQAQPLPQPSQVPTISGGAQRLASLTATAGQWTNNPTSIGYQWERCDSGGQNCQPIAGATNATYQLTKADEGARMTVVVSATNTSGTAHAAASPTTVVAPYLPANTQAPVVQGAPKQSGQVAISGNQWNVTPDTTFADQWERCDASGASCADIAGATTPTYNVTAADVGHTLRVRVTGTDPDGSVPAISAPSAVTIPAAPRWKSLPTIGADPGHVGDTLTIGAGVWTGPAVATDVIELMRCLAACQPISGFSGSHYMIASADAGAVLRVRETATNAGGTTVVWSSWYVGPVISASSGVAALTAGAGAPVAVRNANGRALAFAQVALASTPHALMAGDTSGRRPAATPRVVRIRRAGSITGKLRVWVCTVRPAKQSGAPAACTAAVLISGKTGQVRLPATMTGKLRVIVVRQRR